MVLIEKLLAGVSMRAEEEDGGSKSAIKTLELWYPVPATTISAIDVSRYTRSWTGGVPIANGM